MDLWAKLDTDCWSRLVGDIAVLYEGREWPREYAVLDLRVWSTRVRFGTAERMPAYRALADRWGWGEKRARLLLRCESEWKTHEDAPRAHEGRTRGAGGAHEGRTEGAPHNEQTPNNAPQRAHEGRTEGAGGAHEGRTKGHTREVGEERDGDVAGEPEGSSLRSEPPPPPQGGGVLVEGPDDPSPAWARGLRLPKGVRKSEVVDLVVEVRNRVFGNLESPERCGTAAKPILSLWKAVGHPPLATFRGDLLLVADALHHCPARSYDFLRTSGHRSLSTLFKHAAWDERIDTARRWRAGDVQATPQRTQNEEHPADRAFASFMAILRSRDAPFLGEGPCPPRRWTLDGPPQQRAAIRRALQAVGGWRGLQDSTASNLNSLRFAFRGAWTPEAGDGRLRLIEGGAS